MPIEFITQPENLIKEETKFWKIKKRVEQDYILRAKRTQITIPFEAITAFSNQLKPKQNERDEIKELTDGISRLTFKNKTKKKKIVKLQKKLESSQRKIAILRAYYVDQVAGKKLQKKKFFKINHY